MRRYFLILIATLSLLSCGGPKVQPLDLSGYVWPPPPNPPKFKLVRIIRTDVDIRSKTTSELLFGEEYNFYFKKPHGLAVDREGNAVVSDTYRQKVFILNLEKGSVGEIGNIYGWGELGGVAADNVNGLLAITSGNTVTVLEQASKRIRLTLGQRGEFQRPMGIAFDPARKRIYVADSKRHEVHAYDYDGKHLALIAGRGSAPGEVYFPNALATDSEGRLYVVDSMNWRVQVFNPDFTFRNSFGQHGSQPGAFARPKGIAISDDGYIFVTDAAFGNFQVFDIDGRVYTFVGTPGGGIGQFNTPQGIDIDDRDRVYVVDQTNRRVYVFQYLSERYLKEHPEEAKR